MSEIREQRREDILLAATQEFREWGFERTKMEEIARRAGIGKSTVYEYFPSKSELLIEVLTDGLARMNALMGEFLARPMPFREKLESLLGVMGMSLRETVLPLASMRDCAPAIQFMHKHGSLERDYILGLLRGTVEQAIAAGEIRSNLNPQFAAGLVLALVMAMGNGIIAPDAPKPESVSRAVDLLFEGIAPRE